MTSIAARKLSGTFIFVVLAAGLAPTAANAELVGATLGWQYYGGGGEYNPDADGSVTSGTFVADGAIDGTMVEPGPNPVFNIIAGGSTITFDFSPDTAASPWETSGLSLAPTIYNGIALNLLSNGSFTDVTIDPLTNMAGFVAGDLSFTGNQIQVNWAGLSFSPSTVVTLDVTFDSTSSASPEPATYSLMAVSVLFSCLLINRNRG